MPSTLQLPQALSTAIARTQVNRLNQSVALTVATRNDVHTLSQPLTQAIKAETEEGPRLAVMTCSQHTTVDDLIHCLQEDLSITVNPAYTLDVSFPTQSSGCLLLIGADLLPDTVWQTLIPLMKKSIRNDLSFLVVTVSVASKNLLSRLYGIDQDSCMMWHSAELSA